METTRTEKIHNVYDQCQKIFTPELEFTDEYANIEDEEERRFYNNLFHFFLHQRQKEVIEKGLY